METNNVANNNISTQRPQYDVNEAFEAKLRYLKVSDLQHILRKHSLHTTGNKLSLIGRICDYFRNAINKANAGQLPSESVASMFAEVESMYGSKLNNTTTRAYHHSGVPPPVPIPAPSYIAPPSNPNSISNGGSNGTHNALSPYVQSCFEDNSFCQHQGVLTQTRVLNLKESHGGHVFHFEISKEAANALYTNNTNLNTNQDTTKYCIQLYSFDAKKLESGHQWPIQQTAAHFEVRVNHRVFPIKRGGKKDKDRVADITAYCRSGSNTVTVLWNGSGNYLMYVTLSKRISVDTLVEAVLTKRSRDYDASLEAIKKTLSRRAGSDELQEVSTKVSLMCPATKAVMQIPCRATTCNHLQCFELQSYLMMNERVPRWQCPHCSKTALYKDLFADNFFKKVIEQVSKAEITEIEFKPDATWLPVSKKRKVEQIESNKQVFEILDDDDDPPSTTQTVNNNNNNFSRASTPPNANLNSPANSTITNTYSQPTPSNYYPIFTNGFQRHVEAPETSQFGYDVTKCFLCGSSQSLKRCSRCRGICYCGTECQTKDWDRHRGECKDAAPPNSYQKSEKTEMDSQYAQQKFKMQKKDPLSALVESAVAQQPVSSSANGAGNADDPIELD